MNRLKKNRHHNHRFVLQLSLFAIASLFFHIQTLYPQRVKLAWDLSDNPDIHRYNIYRTTNLDSSFSLVNSVPHPDSSSMDANMEWNTHYYYVATSVDKFGNESGFSNMIDTTLILRTSIDQVVLSLRLADHHHAALEYIVPPRSGYIGIELQKSRHDTLNFHNLRYVTIIPDAVEPVKYHFSDNDLPVGNYYYRLKQFQPDNSFEYSETVKISVSMPSQFKLFQNSPNPFNSSTKISYTLPESGDVELKIYNINGEEIFTLINEFQNAGNHHVTWDGIVKNGNDATSGIYYIRLKSNGQFQFRRMVLLK